MLKVTCLLDGGSFLVPTAIEKYLNRCGELELRVLLLALCCPNLSTKQLADQLGVSGSEVERCLYFWGKNKIIKVQQQASESSQSSPLSLRLTTKEIAKILNESEELKFIVEQLPQILKRVPNQFDMLNLVNFRFNLGMQPEVILQLLKYCEAAGKTSAQAIKKEANFWFECGVSSLEEAEELIKRIGKLSELEEFVKGQLNLSALGATQKRTIEKWQRKFGFEPEVIAEACQLAAQKTETTTVAYVNGILSNWFQKGVKTVKDVKTETGKKAWARRGKTASKAEKEPGFSSLSREDLERL